MNRWVKVPGAGGCLLLAGFFLFGHGNRPGEAHFRTDHGEVAIQYVAPDLKGRDVLEMIKLPGANPWRLGADRPTTLRSDLALHFGDKVLQPGSYQLRAYLDDAGTWWLQAYDSARQVAARLRLQQREAAQPQEHLLISLRGAAPEAVVSIQWGRLLLEGHFSVR